MLCRVLALDTSYIKEGLGPAELVKRIAVEIFTMNESNVNGKQGKPGWQYLPTGLKKPWERVCDCN